MEAEREVVFFFGAGASADFCLPTMAQFNGKVAKLISKHEERKERDQADATFTGTCQPRPADESKTAAYDLLRLALRFMDDSPCPPFRWFDHENLEHFFSLWQMEQQLGIPDSEDKLDVLAKAIAITYQESHSTKWCSDTRRVAGYRGYRKLLTTLYEVCGQSWRSSGRCPFGFITTNYDLAVEDAWEDEVERGEMQDMKRTLRDHAWRGLHPGLGDEEIRQIRKITETGNRRLMLETARYGLLDESNETAAYPFLLKVHGSINWGICPSCGNVKVFSSGMFDKRLREPRVLDVLHEFPCDRHPETRGLGNRGIPDEYRYRPLLVPPTWSKARQCADIREVWRKAALEIRAAKRLVFVGYSMPETDVHLRYLLAASLSTRERVPPVLVVNYHAGRSAGKEEGGTRNRYHGTLGDHQYVNKKFADAMGDIRDFLTSSEV